jgi:hypothetical protein
MLKNSNKGQQIQQKLNIFSIANAASVFDRTECRWWWSVNLILDTLVSEIIISQRRSFLLMTFLNFSDPEIFEEEKAVIQIHN